MRPAAGQWACCTILLPPESCGFGWPGEMSSARTGDPQPVHLALVSRTRSSLGRLHAGPGVAAGEPLLRRSCHCSEEDVDCGDVSRAALISSRVLRAASTWAFA